jgi:carbon-monoxide dehydrogenase medium subunit
VKQRYKVLAETIAEMASVQVRNRATIGGNLCNASPSADLAPPLSVLGARVLVAGVKGSRELALADFFLGPGKTALLPGEILTEVLLAPRRKNSGTVYLKHKRNAMDLALVGVAVSLVMEDLQTCSEANVVLGAVGPTPLSGRRAAEVLQQAKFSKETVDEAASLAAEEAQPINDMRASGWYRRRLVQVLTGRAIREAYERAKK